MPFDPMKKYQQQGSRRFNGTPANGLGAEQQQPQQPAQTFSQMQKNGQARPAPPQAQASFMQAQPTAAPQQAAMTSAPQAHPAPAQYTPENTPWVSQAGVDAKGNKYGPAIGKRDLSQDAGWGVGPEMFFSDQQKGAAKAYADYLKELDPTYGMLQGALSDDPRLVHALGGLTNARSLYEGVDTINGNMSWGDWQGEKGNSVRETLKKRAEDNLAAQNTSRNSGSSLWQTIMGYHPNIPKEYGWTQGWEKFSQSGQNPAGSSNQVASYQANAALNPALGSIAPGGGGMMANAQSNIETPTDDGTGGYDQGGTQNTPPAPSTPPTAAPPTQAPPAPSPRTNVPTNSGWDPVIQKYMQGGNSGGLNNQLMQQIMQALGRPSAYDSDMLMGSYSRLEKQLQEQEGIDRARLNEEMARRGLGESSVYGGRLSDLAVAGERNRSDLAYQLLTDAAKQQSGDLTNALQLAMGFQGMQNDEENRRFTTAFGADQALFQRWLQEMTANHQIDADEMDYWLRMMGL